MSESVAAWSSPEIADYLTQFFTRDFMRARDSFAETEIPKRKADAARRGLVIPTAESLQASERTAAALAAFPALGEEVKALVRARRIPVTDGALVFIRDLLHRLQLETRIPGDQGQRAALRTLADLRLFFDNSKLPPVAGDAADPFWQELEREVPSAAAALRQATEDLKHQRLSYRGPANELRQALWDVLQTLAPDDAVTAQAGYKQEAGTRGPTHRQRAIFIMRRRRGGTDDATLAAIEVVATLARQTYTRSNASTHSQEERDEALQVQRYVEVVLRDLLKR